MMLIELIITPLVRSRQTKAINIRVYFTTVYKHKGISLGIVTIIMSLGKIYYKPEHAACFGSVAKLVKASETNKGTVEGLLSGQNTYTLHKPVRKTFPRNPYTVTNIDDVWEMDLADLSSLSKYNETYKYLLNVIEVFSRYAWSVPLKDKTGTSIKAALKYLFRYRKPITIQSDKCTAIVNTTVRRYLKSQDVNFHTTQIPT